MSIRISIPHRLAFVGLAALALAACKPQTPAEPVAPPTGATAPATAPAADAAKASMAAPFDAKAFAGTFSGTLPCADCPGIDTRLTLKADGTYTLTETYQERAVEPRAGDGTWTVEDGDRRIRLDPNSKSDNDRIFAVLSHKEIRQLDTEGNAIESALPYNLKRTTQ